MACDIIRERYTPIVMDVNGTVSFRSNASGCFLCATDGTITLIAKKADGKPQTTLLSAFPVKAGTYYPLPFYLGAEGGTFTTAGGASGVLGV